MTYRCIKPQCPNDCSECNHALPESDEAAMLVFELLDTFAVDGFDGPLEDGESQLVDQARAWLATRHVTKEAIKQHDAEPVAWMDSDGNISDNKIPGFPIPLYTSAPSIPEERKIRYAPESDYYRVEVYHEGYDEGWNDCRVAVIAASPQPTKGGS